MNRFLNFAIGLGSFVSVIIVTGSLSGRHRDEIANFDALNLCVDIGLVVAAVLFLQFAVERYLFPPDVFTKQRREALLKSAEAGYQKTFFCGTRGIGYLCLFFYASDLLTTHFQNVSAQLNWMAWSVFFLLLALIGRIRAVVLQLLREQKTELQAGGAAL
jgi:hypothetical protein